MADASIFNCVDYDLPPNLSLVNDRVYRRHIGINYGIPITSNVYDGAMIPYSIIKLQANENEYVDAWTSFLRFKLDQKTICYQGHYLHSFLDLIQRITLLDRDNLELERIEDVNMLNSLILPTMFGDPYMTTAGYSTHTSMGEKTNFTAPETKIGVPFTDIPPNPYLDQYPMTLTNRSWGLTRNDPIPTEDTTRDLSYEVIIPLNLLAGLFRSDKLLPPLLTSGMTIRIDWANANQVFAQNINSYVESDLFAQGDFATQNIVLDGVEVFISPTYTINNLEIIMDTYTLHSQLSAPIQQAYLGQGGIPLKFQTYTLNTMANYTLSEQKDDIPIQQSFTCAFKILSTTRLRRRGKLSTFHFPGPVTNSNTLSTSCLMPIFDNQGYQDPSSYLLRFNGVDYPELAVSNKERAYHYWLTAFGKTKLYTDVHTSADYFFKDMGTSFVVDLNRSPYSFKISGSAVSTESNRMISGQRIDGTNPATLFLSLPAIDKNTVYAPYKFLEEDFSGIDGYRTVWTWVEHERVLILSALGNRILV